MRFYAPAPYSGNVKRDGRHLSVRLSVCPYVRLPVCPVQTYQVSHIRAQLTLSRTLLVISCTHCKNAKKRRFSRAFGRKITKISVNGCNFSVRCIEFVHRTEKLHPLTGVGLYTSLKLFAGHHTNVGYVGLSQTMDLHGRVLNNFGG